MKRCAIIMAGGSGTRLWPLSNEDKPKQFCNIIGSEPLLMQTIKRLDGLIDPENIYVVGSKKHEDILNLNVKGLIPEENIILEHIGRNTGPCIVHSMLYIINKIKDDASVCILPADHFIGNNEKFNDALEHCLITAEITNKIISLGITPDHPATGYGYIKCGPKASGFDDVYIADSFVEKPDKFTALKYLKAGSYYWNCGIFISTLSKMLEEIEKYMPDTLNYVRKTLEADRQGDCSRAEEYYSSIKSISIDYAIMEKTDDLYVKPATFSWSDIGSFDALHNVLKKDDEGNSIIDGKYLLIDSKNNVIYSKKLVAMLDIEDLVVIDTEDVLYVCKAGNTEQTKLVAERSNSAFYSGANLQ